MPNWKAPGPHFGQGFWLKNFKIFKKDLKKNLQQCLENGNVPMWMIKGKTILIQTNKEEDK